MIKECTIQKWLKILSNQIFQIKNLTKNQFYTLYLIRHITEHLKEKINVKKEMTNEELEFYYFL